MNEEMVAKELIKIAKNLMYVNISVKTDGKSDYSMFYDDMEQNELDLAEKAGKKYILYKKEDREEVDGLCRIRACKDFGDVKKGDFGGLVESEKNLSQKGNCWIYDDAKVSCHAKVFGNAKIYNGAWVCGYARVGGNACVNYDVSEGRIME